MSEFATTAQGCRLATSVGGVLTGRGADIIIIDDPLKPEEALSQAQRQAANDWFDHTLYSRFNDTRTGAIILIMHRLHEDDLTGHVLAQEDWEIVRLPAIADDDEVHRAETMLERQSFRRRRGAAGRARAARDAGAAPPRELSVFPKGKHDDQVDSTAQMLDWFKRAGQEPQDWMWQQYKQAQPPGRDPARAPIVSPQRRRGAACRARAH